MPHSPPYTLTPLILSQVAQICEQVGHLDGTDGLNWGSRSPQLRKDNRIRSIHSSLAIENNSLSLDQVTDVIHGKRVLGLQREVQEVKNTFAAYESLPRWQSTDSADFLEADKLAEATPFIEFMLSAIISSLRNIKNDIEISPCRPTDQVSDQATVQVKKLLRALCPLGKASSENLMTVLKLKHRPTFRNNYLRPAMDQNFVTMTQPNSPNSPTQKYRLTEAGKTILKTLTQN